MNDKIRESCRTCRHIMRKHCYCTLTASEFCGQTRSPSDPMCDKYELNERLIESSENNKKAIDMIFLELEYARKRFGY